MRSPALFLAQISRIPGRLQHFGAIPLAPCGYVATLEALWGNRLQRLYVGGLYGVRARVVRRRDGEDGGQ